MDKKIFIEKVYQNIEAFYAMTLASAAISSYNSEESDEDSAKVISFIGNAYKLDEEFIGKCKEEILGNMMGVALISDYLALNAVDMMDKEDIERLELYEIKGRAIEEVNRMECQECIFKDSRTSTATRNRMNYEAFHHPYNAKFRYFNISRLADNGDLTATRQLGLLSVLGIGCEKDYEKAEKMFLRCVFWSDKVSVKLLSYLYCLQNKKDKEEIFENLYLLNKEDRKNIRLLVQRRQSGGYLSVSDKAYQGQHDFQIQKQCY